MSGPDPLVADVHMVGVLLHGLQAVEAGLRDAEALDRLVDHVANAACDELAGDERTGVMQLGVELYYRRACR